MEGETVLLLGDVVGKLMREKVAVVSGVDRVGALRAPPFSSFSSAISPISSSCWFTSFKRSIITCMDPGSWGRTLVSLAYTSGGIKSPHHETTTNLVQVIWVVDLRQISSELLEEHDTPVLCLLYPNAHLLWQPLVDLWGISMKGSLYLLQPNQLKAGDVSSNTIMVNSSASTISSFK